jgi:parvulin-like peptidyl-prolyl isomerase
VAPTPEASAAAQQVTQIVDAVYQRYTGELELYGMEPSLTQEDFRQALERQYRQQALTTRVQEQLVPEETFTPSSEPTRVQARHILLGVDVPEDAPQETIDAAYEAQRIEAATLVQQLRAGADFAELARQYSDDPGSKEAGGDVGYFNTEGVTDEGATFVPEFVDAAFALQEDAISDPVRTQFGWHIIQVTDREIGTEDEQLRTARSDALDEWLEQQRAAAQISPMSTPTPQPPEAEQGTTLDATPEPTYMPGPPTPLPTPGPVEPLTGTDSLTNTGVITR